MHRKETLGDDQDSIFCVNGTDARELSFKRNQIAMTIELQFSRRGACASLKACVGENVQDDMVGRTNKSFDGSKACGPTGWIKNGIASVQKSRKLFF
jgi:hypothetical protein